MIRRFPIPFDDPVPTGAVNAYLVGRDRAMLVDPGGRTPDLDAAVAAADVDHVVVTHTHRDHVGAVTEYAAETGATVWARRFREGRFEAAVGRPPDRTLTEGTTLSTDAGSVTVLDTPGHAPDHVAFVVGEDTHSTAVLCGDLAIAEGSVAVAAPEGDVRAYLTSLRRLRIRSPDRLFPGHGPAIDDPRATLEYLLEHRREREGRVRAAVEAGARELDAVVEAAYEKDVSAVWGLARATTCAHLEKLAVEGAVDWDRAAERATPR